MQFAQGSNTVGIVALLSQALSQAGQLRALSVDDVDPETGDPAKRWTLDFAALADTNPQAEDRQFGVCPIPIYDFTASEVGVISESNNLPAIREILRAHNVLQYFYPPADQLTLGVLERLPGTVDDVVSVVATAPGLGHPYGETEIVPQGTAILDMIDALTERNLVVEGEMTQVLTQEGMEKRASVKFSPREGVVSKVINRVSVNIDITTKFFGG